MVSIMKDFREENNKYKITVVVITYNPDYKKLFQTLYSIVIQKNIIFEIIVSDDGTIDFDKKGIEQWFIENNFFHLK